MTSPARLLQFVITSACLIITGCGDSAPAPEAKSSTAGDPHVHPSEGPHGGEIIELGNEQYHAELLHEEDSQSVTVYILDGSAAKLVPIEADEVTINAVSDGVPSQFVLAGQPEDSDPEGQCSRFTSADAKLFATIDDHNANPKLIVTIDGRSFRGEITHRHD